MADAPLIVLRKAELFGKQIKRTEVFLDNELIGWVTKSGVMWVAHAADPNPLRDGHRVGSFPTRREAVDEVYIQRRVAI